MLNHEIHSLKDLKSLRSAPILDVSQSKKLLQELSIRMQGAEWFTVGIMAPSATSAILVLREIEAKFNWSPMRLLEKPTSDGPVFLKANQNTMEIYVRIEYGLGEGVLISGQNNNQLKEVDTFGPFPLDFFSIKDFD